MHSIFLFQVSSVEIERICNAVDNNVLETAAIGVPLSGGGPEQLVIAAVFKNSDNPTADLNQLRMSFNSAVQKKLNPLFKVPILCSELTNNMPYICIFMDNLLTFSFGRAGFQSRASPVSSKNSNK